MKAHGLRKTALVIAICALVGALAGIAGSAAAPSKKSSAQAAKTKQARMMRHAFGRGMRMHMGFGGPMGGGPVHASVVVPKRDGSGFFTVTEDSGTLNSVDGTTVHLKEGTDKATYKDDAAIDVGSDAKVIRDGKDAKLSDLKQGDHVHVVTGTPKGNLVIAADDAFLKQRQQRFEDHHGWGMGGGPGGPPPGAPMGPPPGDQGGSNQNGSNSLPQSSGSSS